MPGYVKVQPNKSVSFEYLGTNVSMGPFIWNPFLECWLADYEDSEGNKYTRVPIRCGVNLLNGLRTVLPKLLMINNYNPDADIDINMKGNLMVLSTKDLEALTK